jgi:hypothetical protein
MPAAKERLRLVVLGDSTAFTDDQGPQLPTDPALYPNVVRAVLQDALERPVAVSVIARAGTDTLDTWRTLTKDRHVMFEVLTAADAVVVGVGSFDHAPAGLPAAVEALSTFVRPAWLRRQVRLGLRLANPIGVRATLGRYTRVPRAEFARLYDNVLLQVRSLARGAAGVVMGPTSHRSYGGTHPSHADRARLHAEIAARHGFPFVPCWPLVHPFTDAFNADGIHWPSHAHAAVGEALAGPLVEQLLGERDVPPPPAWD